MQLPLSTESNCGDFPADQSCLICGKESSPDSAGSISLDISTSGFRDPESVRCSKTALSINWAGVLESTGEYEFVFLDIIKKAPKGKGRIHFCSTACLRTFFNQVVDAVEQEVDSLEPSPDLVQVSS